RFTWPMVNKYLINCRSRVMCSHSLIGMGASSNTSGSSSCSIEEDRRWRMKLSGVQRPGFHVWGTGSQSYVIDNPHQTQKEKIIMPHDIAGSHEESEPDHGHSETSAGAGG